MRLTRPPRHCRPHLRSDCRRPPRGPSTPTLTVTRLPRRISSCVSRPPADAHAIAPMSPVPARRRTALRRLVVIAEVVVLGLVLSGSVSRVAAAETTQMLALPATVDELLVNIRNWLVGILAGLATVFLSLGGVRYLMAGGDPGEVEKAKTSFKAAAIGYALAALAPLVVTVLQGLVGA
jgi:hypothetical protein